MAQGSGRARFAEEPVLHRARSTCLSRCFDHFQCNTAVQRFVERAISDPHRASPQFPERTIFAPVDFESFESKGVRPGFFFCLLLVEPGAQ